MVEPGDQSEFFTLVVKNVAEKTLLNIGDRFVVTSKGLKGNTQSKEVLIGKASNCQIKLHPEDETVFSQYQAKIDYNVESYFQLTCVSPTVPTRIRMIPGNKYLLNPSDWILFGYNYGFAVETIYNEPSIMSKYTDEKVVDFRMNRPGTLQVLKQNQKENPPYLKIRWINGYPELIDKVQEFKSAGVYSIGRLEDSDIRLANPDEPGDAEISRQHAFLEYTPQLGWFIYENKAKPSLNGSYFCIKTINDRTKPHSLPVLLMPEWEIYTGDTSFQAEFPEDDQ